MGAALFDEDSCGDLDVEWDVPRDALAELGEWLPDAFVGRVLGGTYRILRLVGQGSMGFVFEAQHLRLYRKVAIKVLPAEAVAHPDLRVRFEQEAELISKIRSRHVVGVLDYDVTELGEAYLVLELLEGETLATRLARTSPLRREDALDIVRQIALGLSAAHRADVVHRDLKPENVFLTCDPDEPVFVKLLDFGISKSLQSSRGLTASRMILGTPNYMAPEQAAGLSELVDARTDQHTLAVLAYEMLTGVHPFGHDDVTEALRRVTTVTPRRASSVAPWLPPSLDVVLDRGMAKYPGDRFANVIGFWRALQEAARAGPPPHTDGAAARHLGSQSAVQRILDPAFEVGRESGNAETEPDDGARRAIAELGRARDALHGGAMEAAVKHAENAYDAATGSGAATESLDPSCEALLALVFLRRLGSAKSVVRKVGSTADGEPMSPRTVYLLSRLEAGMTVNDVQDVSGMPPLETLRRLVDLVVRGSVQVG